VDDAFLALQLQIQAEVIHLQTFGIYNCANKCFQFELVVSMSQFLKIKLALLNAEECKAID
jgi:hypothetical protein